MEEPMFHATPAKPLMTIDELCLYLGISRRALERMNEVDPLPRHVLIGKRRRYMLKDVETWLEERKVPSTPSAKASTNAEATAA